MLQRINHSYPVSSCIYHQRPGCGSRLAQEDDQTRRSKQYPVQAAGGGRGFWRDAQRPFTGLLCSRKRGTFITFIIVLSAFKQLKEELHILPFTYSWVQIRSAWRMWRNVSFGLLKVLWWEQLKQPIKFTHSAKGGLHLSPKKGTTNGHLEATQGLKCVRPNTKRKWGKEEELTGLCGVWQNIGCKYS